MNPHVCCDPSAHKSTFTLVAEVYADLLVAEQRTPRTEHALVTLERLLGELADRPR